MIHPTSLKTLRYFARAYPRRTATMVAALSLSGLLEGVGLIALLPLITIVTGHEGMSGITPPRIESVVRGLFSFAGVPINLVTLLAFLVTTMLIKSLLAMAATNQVAHAAPRVGSELRLSLMRSLLGARWAHFTDISSGASANAIGTEAARATDVYRQACTIFSFLVLMFVYTVLAFLVSWQVTLGAIVASVLMMKILQPLVRWNRAAGEAQTRLYSESLKQLTEVITGIKPVKAMAREQSYSRMMENLTGSLEKAQRQQILNEDGLRIMAEPLMIFFLAIGMYALLTYTSIAANELFFMAYLFSRLVARTMNAQRFYQSMVVHESAFWSLRGRIDAAETAAEIFAGTKAPTLDHALTLDNISFGYDGKMVLDQISALLQARQFHALLGPSGAGKTTLIDLITGLHRPSSGQVLIDNVPLDKIDIRRWRGLIGYVPQEIILFQGTVFYNVTMGDAAFTAAAVENALKAAGIWDFIAGLSDGVNTIVGERGTRLSGGQRQRIAIARAIIHTPALLILDEATSALDNATEQEILKTVRGLSQQITVVAISHKESIATLADRVFLLQNGQIKAIKT